MSPDADGRGGSDADGQSQGGPSRRSVLRGAGLAAIAGAPAIVSSAGVGRAAPLDGPSGVHVAYGDDPRSTVAIGWTGGPAATARVRYGEAGDLDTTALATPRPVPGRDAVAYSVRLTGLAAGTTYAYEVELDGTTRGPFEFRTAPDTDQPFRVTAVGDHGIADPDNPGQRANTDDPERVVDLTRDRLDAAEREGLVPGFHLGVGDISYANGKPSTWELYFSAFEDLYAEYPFMTTPGNHEAEPGTGLTQYDRRLNDLMPVHGGNVDLEHEQRWYDFTYGNATFVALNTTADNCGDVGRAEEFVPLYDPRCSDPGGAQTYGEVQEEYLRETLAAAEADPDVKWKVVYFHGPFWTTSPDHAPREGLRERWGAVLDEYDVDLVLSGDNHVYERSKPIESNTETRHGEYGTTYVTNGTGGTSHYAVGEGADWLAVQTADHFGITQLDVSEESIDVRYVVATSPGGDAAEGDVVDQFSIVKDERGRPTQRQIVDRVDASVSVEGTRTDDGSAFRGGATNRVDLGVSTASEPVLVRDVLPTEWEVVCDADGVPYGDATRIERGEDVQYVYFGTAPARAPAVTYFVRAPEGAEATGQYAFGPFQARASDGAWTDVPGTGSEEVVVSGPDASL